MLRRHLLVAGVFCCLLTAGWARGQNVWYVDDAAALGGDGTSWPTAYKYLQDPLVVASAGDGIHVAQGTYLPDRDSANPDGTGDREATFQLISGVELYGGYRGCPGGDCGGGNPDERDIELYETILSGDLTGDDAPGLPDPYDPLRSDNSYHVLTGSGAEATSILDGFTIIGGNASGFTGTQQRGGGVRNSAGSPSVFDCTFKENAAIQQGGAIWNSGGDPTLTGCSFVNNNSASSGGAVATAYQGGGSLCANECRFIGNSADSVGGGIHHDSGSLTLVKCTFLRNSAYFAGGVATSIPTSVAIADSVFYGNAAYVGGGASVRSNFPSSIVNCVFSGNEASGSGGGLALRDGTNATVTNCTITHNTALNFGGGMYLDAGASLVLSNGILWGNSPNQIAVFDSALAVTYTNVQDGWAGSGNIDDAPLFVDVDGPDDIPGTADDNLRLSLGSPSINTGDPKLVLEPGETDLDGRARVLCDRVDMGAYEFGIGDYDCDQDVHLTDFAAWEACMTGSARRTLRFRLRGVRLRLRRGRGHAGLRWVSDGLHRVVAPGVPRCG